MRFLIVALLMLALSTAVWAQPAAQSGAPPQQGSSSGAGKIFGIGNCRQKIPCPDQENALSAAALAANAGSCVAENFGMNRPSGVFDSIAGLDGNGCLTVTADAVSAGMQPLCCVTTLPDSTCTFQCSLPAH